jgi:Rap1a immunity proteins
MRQAIYAAAAALLLAGEARSDMMTGNELYDFCTVGEGGFCVGYITGVAEALRGAQELREASMGGRTFCVPRKVSRRQLADIVTTYLRDHPAEPLAMISVHVVLVQNFPCS